MKNRPEIGYLTILGLSLTVVLALCKDDCRFKSFADSINEHIIQLNTDNISGVIISESDAYYILYNNELISSITSSFEFVVNIEPFVVNSVCRDIIVDFDFIKSDIFSSLPVFFLEKIKCSNRATFLSLSLVSSCPVRAGPFLL